MSSFEKGDVSLLGMRAETPNTHKKNRKVGKQGAELQTHQPVQQQQQQPQAEQSRTFTTIDSPSSRTQDLLS